MNSQELRALQEAYNQVYQLDEISQKTATNAFATRATGEFEYDTNPSDYTKSGKSKADETKRRIEKKHGKAAGQHAERAAHARIFGRGKKGFTKMPPKPTKTNEAVDLYDIILSHLLDEGYADTEQAAEAIMVNMSDDWRESIVEGAAGAFVPSKVDDSNNRRDMLKNRYGQDVSPRIPGPSGGGQFEKPSSNPAGALRLAKTSSKGDTKTA